MNKVKSNKWLFALFPNEDEYNRFAITIVPKSDPYTDQIMSKHDPDDLYMVLDEIEICEDSELYFIPHKKINRHDCKIELQQRGLIYNKKLERDWFEIYGHEAWDEVDNLPVNEKALID